MAESSTTDRCPSRRFAGCSKQPVWRVAARTARPDGIVVVSAADDRARVAACADYGAWLVEAPVVLVFGIHEDGGHHPDFDIGRMAQNAMVVCHAEGLASCPVTVARQNDLREALGIPPPYHVPMMVGLGYGSASDGTRGSHPRRPLSEIVHMGSWQDDGESPTG